jgi:uncharacterized protein YndB with AHSA1/START domain
MKGKMESAMATTIVTPDQDALIIEIDIAAPAERVFKALTDPDQLRRWFTGPSCPVKTWNMDARLGGKYDYATAKGTVAINGVTDFECHGEILEIDPPRLLVYTWIANWHDHKQHATTVRWELEAHGKTTHVKVTHSGLAKEKFAREDYSGGWPGLLNYLRAFVEKNAAM